MAEVVGVIATAKVHGGLHLALFSTPKTGLRLTIVIWEVFSKCNSSRGLHMKNRKVKIARLPILAHILGATDYVQISP